MDIKRGRAARVRAVVDVAARLCCRAAYSDEFYIMGTVKHDEPGPFESGVEVCVADGGEGGGA